jgi:hypothetical protein
VLRVVLDIVIIAAILNAPWYRRRAPRPRILPIAPPADGARDRRGLVDVVCVLESHVSTAFAVLVAMVVVDLLVGGHRYSAVVRGARSLPVPSLPGRDG